MKTKVLAIVLMLVVFAMKVIGQVYPYKYTTKDNMYIYSMEEQQTLKDDNEITSASLAVACIGDVVGLNIEIRGIGNDNIKALAKKSENQNYSEAGGIICSNSGLYGNPMLHNYSQGIVDCVVLEYDLSALIPYPILDKAKNMSVYDIQAKSIQLLRSYDIKQINVGGINITFDNFKTSATINAMLTDLAKIHTFPGSNTKRNTTGGSSNTQNKPAVSSSTTTTNTQSTVARSAKIKSVKLEHDVYKDGKKGMNIKVSFDISGYKNVQGRVNAYFYFKDGKALHDENGKYCTTANDVATWRDFTPRYDNSTYTDFNLFIPIDELHLQNLPKGTYGLKLWTTINVNHKELYKSDWSYFNYWN